MDLFQILTELEDNEDVHLGRLLILIYEFSKRAKSKEVEGLTKLAKLDFLLRYPKYLERALLARKASIKNLKIKEYEKLSVESKMVRYKYGPWDFRYRKFINILIAKGLVYYRQEGKTIKIGITEKGKIIGESLSNELAYTDVQERAKLIKTNFDLGATKLMRFIYDTFPEIGSLSMGTEITN
ncbi:hypothetical protein [Lewinella sp. LCG006]|uniref:hypothetical protein n=1 Tax=Lewinella sp. LCG006 TaxID=3231911 RepID=UPI003460C2DE